MSQPKDQAKVLCYWDQDQPGGEAAAICIYQNDGFYLDGQLQISPTWWEYLDEFDTPNDAKLRSIIRDLRDELSRRKEGKTHRTQHCAECDRLSREIERWKPKPMSEAPKDGTYIFTEVAGDALILNWDPLRRRWWDCVTSDYLEDNISESLTFFLLPPTPDELKQIGGGK